jgi:hypothetical protein
LRSSENGRQALNVAFCKKPLMKSGHVCDVKFAPMLLSNTTGSGLLEDAVVVAAADVVVVLLVEEATVVDATAAAEVVPELFENGSPFDWRLRNSTSVAGSSLTDKELALKYWRGSGRVSISSTPDCASATSMLSLSCI